MTDPVETAEQGKSSFRIVGGALTGKLWDVTAIVAGLTANGEMFGADVLERAVASKVLEGMPVHAYGFGETLAGKRKQTHTPDSVNKSHPGGLWKNRTGHLKDVRMGMKDGVPAIVGQIQITSDDDARALLADQSSGRMPALSVDVRTMFRKAADGIRHVLEIVRGDSIDMVTTAAAGGAFERVAAGSGCVLDEMALEVVRVAQAAEPAAEKPKNLAKLLNSKIDAAADRRSVIVNDLAAKARVDDTTIYQYLSGAVSCPPVSSMKVLSRELGIPIGSLKAAAQADGCQYGERIMEGNEIRTADALRAAYPELVAALVKPLETETARATESVKALTVERDALKATVIAKDTEVASLAAENAGYKATETARATEAKVDSLIAASKLGDHVANKAIVSETFIGQVRACKDETSMKALIADREALVGAVPARATEGVVGAGGRSSIETGGAGDKAEEKAFLETDYFGGRLVQSANDGDIVIRLSKETLAAAGRA